MNPEVLQRVLECRELPSLPAVAARVMELTGDEQSSLRDLGAVIAKDQALAAKVLKMVNSSFFGQRGRCSTINQAIVVLGLSAVKTLALGFSLVGAVSEKNSEGFDHIAYWRRALYTGIAARCISKRAGSASAEEAFLGGLLQDIGMIALDRALGAPYRAILARAGRDHRSLSEFELTELEVQHADIGAMLAHRWHLPEELTLSVKYHERPTAAPAAHSRIVRAVGLGNTVSDVLTDAHPAKALALLYARAGQWFGFPRATADDILREVNGGAKEIAGLLGIEMGPGIEIHRVLSEAQERLLAAPVPLVEEVHERRDLEEPGSADDLTGIASRRTFDRNMVVAFERTRAGGGTLSVAIFEVDALDEIERACGHDISDTVLVSVAGRIHGVFSDPGLLMCRYSRARFAVVMPGTERIEAVRLAELAQERIAGTPVKVILESNAPPSMPVTVSVGVASATPSVAARLEDFSALTAICEQSLGIARMNGPSKMRVSAPAA